MKVAAITRFKVGAILELLHKLHWSQHELARRSGISYEIVNKLMNFQRKPTDDQCSRLQRAFGEAGEYIDVLAIWPDDFKPFRQGMPRVVQVQDIALAQLEGFRTSYVAMLEDAAPDDPATALDRIEQSQLSNELLESRFKDRAKRVIKLRLEGMKFKEIAKQLNISHQMVHQIWKHTVHVLQKELDEDDATSWQRLIKEYGLSEERVRQLREAGLLSIRNKHDVEGETQEQRVTTTADWIQEMKGRYGQEEWENFYGQ